MPLVAIGIRHQLEIRRKPLVVEEAGGELVGKAGGDERKKLWRVFHLLLVIL
jgi:hypothetical protein